MPPVALFDLDNTLVNRQAAFERWARRFVGERGLGDDATERLFVLDDDGFATRAEVFGPFRVQFGIRESTAELVAEYRASYVRCFTPDPMVIEALAKLRGLGWKVGVVTNGPPSQKEKLEQAALLGLLDGYCISDVVGVAKPDRRIFDEALRRCSDGPVDAASVWMVGDTAVPDIAGGIRAGLRTIWMHRGRTWDAPDYRPDEIAGSIGEAVDLMLNKSEGHATG